MKLNLYFLYRFINPAVGNLDDGVHISSNSRYPIRNKVCKFMTSKFSMRIGEHFFPTHYSSIWNKLPSDIRTCYTLQFEACDYSREDIMNTAKRVLQEVGRVTILVNNAGVLSARPILDLTPEDIEDTFKVNVLSHFYTIQAFLPSMIGDNKPNLLNYSGDEARIAPSGHIVAVLSVASFIPCVGLSDYCATKSAALMLSESLELELSEKGLHNQIYVTRVFPFLLNTRMFAGCKPRLPWLFDIVDAEYCARAIVNSVRTNRREVFVHNRYKLLPLIKCLLPDRALRCLYNLTNTRQLISQRNKFVSTVNS
ncbi:unnamed protein product [Dicrocoelium dendriticum]|nr:unnamed protein product [Dicrocoelium dendriticum]